MGYMHCTQHVHVPQMNCINHKSSFHHIILVLSELPFVPEQVSFAIASKVLNVHWVNTLMTEILL